MTTSNQYDYLNRLTQISSQPSGTGVPPVSFNYGYNPANQRTKDTLADGSYWVYNYDTLGQVITGHKYFYDNSPVPGQQFDYTFDTVGNRTQTKAGGDQTGGNQRIANYSANTLNQIVSRDYPGTNDVVGVALATNGVKVNGQTAFHKGEYFWGAVSTNNTASAKWQQVTVASGGGSTAGGMYVPKTPEQFKYDADGNLTNDGHWTYRWDAENRLVAMTNNTGVGPLYGLAFAYDAKGRRIQKVATTNGTAFTTQNFLYDGWNLLATLNPQSSILQSFMWGGDLSGSMQGAGGVGGLLAVTYNGSVTTNCFVAFDANGNVASLVNAANGTTVASYEYGPFGEVIRATGPMAKVNPFTFQTEYYDWETDKIYWKHRYYDPSPGRWASIDPFDEPGFGGRKDAILPREDLEKLNLLDSDDDVQELIDKASAQHVTSQNLYVMVNNDPIQNVDLYGLVCGVVADRTKALMSSGINAGHEWLEYGGTSVGFWPNRGYVVLRPDPAAQAGVPVYWQWDTVQKKSGTLKWGSAAGTPCSCATCDQIIASLNAVPNPGWHSFPIRNNCRRFVKWALDGSCLSKGKETSFNP